MCEAVNLVLYALPLHDPGRQEEGTLGRQVYSTTCPHSGFGVQGWRRYRRRRHLLSPMWKRLDRRAIENLVAQPLN